MTWSRQVVRVGLWTAGWTLFQWWAVIGWPDTAEGLNAVLILTAAVSISGFGGWYGIQQVASRRRSAHAWLRRARRAARPEPQRPVGPGSDARPSAAVEGRSSLEAGSRATTELRAVAPADDETATLLRALRASPVDLAWLVERVAHNQTPFVVVSGQGVDTWERRDAHAWAAVRRWLTARGVALVVL